MAVARGAGAVIEDVDGNCFLDFTAGIAVCAAGHCHPDVVQAIQSQSERLLHMSGTDFYYGPQSELAERLAKLAPPAARSVASSAVLFMTAPSREIAPAACDPGV